MRIKVIFTGGTIGSKTADNTVGLTDTPYKLLECVSGDDADFSVCEPYRILSEELSGERLICLLECVRQATKESDGVIVTHGTDTLAFTAAFLSLTLSDTSVPVVLVSSGYPLDDKRANGYDNFKAALSLIKSGESGVYAAWTSNGAARLHHGARILTPLPYNDFVESLFGEEYGKTEYGVFRKNPHFKIKPSTHLFAKAQPKSLDGLRKVLRLEAVPEMCYPTLDDSTKAVLIQTYHSGTLCADKRLEEFVDNAKRHGTEIFLVGVGARDAEYESVKKYKAMGVYTLAPICPPAAYIKSGLAISMGYNLRDAMRQNCGGETV